jgi:hypothetical protein
MIPAPKFHKPYAALFLGFLAIITFIGLFSTTSANAAYYGGGFRSAPMARVYVAPRPVYIAPRPVIIARPVVPIYTPRPVIVARPPVIVAAPMVPYVAPAPVYVTSSGMAQSSGADVLIFIAVVILAILLLGGSVYYYDPFAWWGPSVVVGGCGGYIYDGCDYGIDAVVYE